MGVSSTKKECGVSNGEYEPFGYESKDTLAAPKSTGKPHTGRKSLGPTVLRPAEERLRGPGPQRYVGSVSISCGDNQ